MIMSKCSRKYLNNHQVKVLLSILLLIAYSLPLNATVRYVSKTGNSTPPYITWETAADSIQECINVCVFGDTIYVANGVYAEQVVMIPGLSLIGAGMDSCVIYLSATGVPAVQIMDTCLFKGFKILLPNTLNTWGIQADQNGDGSLITENRIVNASLGTYLDGIYLKLYKNVFENMKSDGIWVFSSNSIIRGNYIYTDPNSQVGTTGIRIDAFNNYYKPIIDSNYILAINSYGIKKSFGTRPIIVNNHIVVTGISIELSSSDSAIVNNNTIIALDWSDGIRNQATQYLQANNNYLIGKYLRLFFIGPDNKIKNNVVSNAVGEIRAWGNQNLKFQFNNVWNSNVSYSGFAPDTTNLSVDPMIVNDDTTQGKLDFHLQKYSPLIDTGDPNILDKDSSRSDIGLYGGPYGESYIYIDLPPRTPVNLTANIDSNIVTLKWNKNTESDFSYYHLFYDTTKNFQIDSTKLVSSQPDTFYYFVIPPETDSLYFKLTAVDNQGNQSNPSEELRIIITAMNDNPMTISDYLLYQNYPNPFNPSTKIGYKLKDRGYVKLYVYDIKGELVSVLVNEIQETGYYEVEFNATGSHSGEVRNLPAGRQGLASGVYIYQIFVSSDNRIPVFSDIKKMIYIK